MSSTIAYFTPLPPQRSGIADYSATLLPYLADLCAVEVFVDEPAQIEPIWAQRFPLHAIADFMARPGSRWHYDMCLYHMGNQPRYHEHIYQALIRYPGIVVLHEIGLLGFYLHRHAMGLGPAAFVREMGYAYGLSGIHAARAILHTGLAYNAQDYPLYHRIAEVSQGIIVHTHAARMRILQEVPRARVIHIPLAARAPVSTPPVNQPDWLAHLPAQAVVLGSFGYIAPSKRIDIVLRAVALLQEDSPELYYLLVGEPVDHHDLLPVIQELGLEQKVHITGFVDSATFEACLRAIDIGVNLRTGPSGGEMSAGVVQLLAAGRPTIVSDVDGFSELPADCVIKIKQDEFEVDRLATALRRLIDNPGVRVAYGVAAQRYARGELSFSRAAEQYLAFIQACLSR